MDTNWELRWVGTSENSHLALPWDTAKEAGEQTVLREARPQHQTWIWTKGGAKYPWDPCLYPTGNLLQMSPQSCQIHLVSNRIPPLFPASTLLLLLQSPHLSELHPNPPCCQSKNLGAVLDPLLLYPIFLIQSVMKPC